MTIFYEFFILKSKKMEAKELPYLVTILIGLAGWTVESISERLTDAKTISYNSYYSQEVFDGDYKEYLGENFKVFTIIIKNNTISELYKNIYLWCEINSNDPNEVFYVKSIEGLHPIKFKGKIDYKCSSKGTDIEIPVLHPNSSARIKFYYKGETRPIHYLICENNPNTNNAKPILFREVGLQTFISDNYVGILFVLLFFWIFCMLIFLYKNYGG